MRTIAKHTKIQGSNFMKIQVVVKAGSRHHEGIKVVDDVYEVRVKDPAIEGRANKRVIELLAKYFKLTKSQIKIIHGEASKKKLIEVDRSERSR